MGTRSRHDVHVVRPLVLGGDDARRPDDHHRSRGSPTRRARSPPTTVDRCDLLLVTHGHFDHFGDALMVGSRTRPTWPCIHELSLWLARNYAHKDARDRDEQGRHGRGRRASRSRWSAPTTRRATSTRGAEAPIYLGEPVGFIVELENGFRVLLRRRHGRVRRHAADRRAVPPGARDAADRRPLHDGPAPAPRIAIELLGVKHVAPMHYGTFPILAGTPDQLRAASRAAASRTSRSTRSHPAGRSPDAIREAARGRCMLLSRTFRRSWSWVLMPSGVLLGGPEKTREFAGGTMPPLIGRP